MEHDMLRRFGCALCALAFALTALPTAAFAQQPEEQAAVQQSLSATDVREMQQADAAVTALTGGSDYAQMTEDERTDAALQQLDALTAQGLVKQGSVYTDAENGMISFTYSCGALGGILLTDPEEENTAALPELDESQLQELAENKRVARRRSIMRLTTRSTAPATRIMPTCRPIGIRWACRRIWIPPLPYPTCAGWAVTTCAS